MTGTRLAGADFVRALACLLVLAHHLIQRLSPYAIGSDIRPFLQWGLMGSFGVAAFFVLSGYLLARPFWQAYDAGEAMPSPRIYAMRRAARILPGYWLALTVSFVLSFTLFGLTFVPDLFTRYLAGFFALSDFHYSTLFPVEYNGPLWSISFEVTSYALLPLCLGFLFWMPVRARSAGASLAVWVAVIGLVVGGHYLVRTYWPIDGAMRGWNFGLVGGAKEWMPRFNPLAFFAIFAIGALAAGLQVRLARLKSWLLDVATIGALGYTGWSMASFAARGPTEGWGLFDIPYGFPGFPAAVAVALAAAPSSRVVGWLLDNPPAQYIARISFGIYVWHFLVIEVLRQNWYPRFFHGGVESFGDWLMLCGAVTGISILIAHVSYRVLEAPVIAWARGLERRATPSPAAAAQTS